MNKSKLDRIIKNRAQERVDAKVEAFKKEIGAAFKKLHPAFAPSYYNGWLPDQIPANVREILDNIAVGGYLTARANSSSNYGDPVTWPAILWETEEAEVEKQLMATLDEMQKALCAPDATEGGNKPTQTATQ